MRILVTGNAGFIGRYLCEALLKQGHHVVGLDKRENTPFAPNMTCVVGNILHRDSVNKAMAGCDLVCNLAAEHQDFGISRGEYFEVNQEGTRVLLESATQIGVKRFLFYSSVAVYGTALGATTEETRPQPDNDYGASKLAAEGEVLRWIDESTDSQAIIIRPTVVYGERMNDYSNIYRLVNQIAKRRFLLIGEMQNIKSLAYVQNLVDATLFSLEQFAPGCTVFNYSERDHLSSREIAMVIARSLGISLPPLTLPLKPALLLAQMLDVAAHKTGINFPITSARIRKLNTPTPHLAEKILQMGFQPRFTNEEGLERTVKWFKENVATASVFGCHGRHTR